MHSKLLTMQALVDMNTLTQTILDLEMELSSHGLLMEPRHLQLGRYSPPLTDQLMQVLLVDAAQAILLLALLKLPLSQLAGAVTALSTIQLGAQPPPTPRLKPDGADPLTGS